MKGKYSQIKRVEISNNTAKFVEVFSCCMVCIPSSKFSSLLGIYVIFDIMCVSANSDLTLLDKDTYSLGLVKVLNSFFDLKFALIHK